jgi:hypothetical protein
MLHRDPHDDAPGQIAFGFLEIIADGRIAIAHAGPSTAPGGVGRGAREGSAATLRGGRPVALDRPVMMG